MAPDAAMEDQMQDAEVEYEAEVAAGVKEYGCSGVIGQAHEKVKKEVEGSEGETR